MGCGAGFGFIGEGPPKGGHLSQPTLPVQPGAFSRNKNTTQRHNMGYINPDQWREGQSLLRAA